MKKKLIILLMAVMVLGALNTDAQKRSKQRTTTKTAKTAQTTKKTAQFTSIKPIITEKTMKEDGMTLTYQHIELPVYYKLPQADKFYSNGYCDSSFAIDWPISLNGESATNLQNMLLVKLKPEAKTLEELYQSLTVCSYSDQAKRVAEMPSNSDDECMRERLVIFIYRLTHNLLGYGRLTDIYTGSGTAAGVMFETDYMNIDLANNRVLTAEMCFKPGIETIIAEELMNDDDMWEMLWDEYKANPTMPDNFKIDDESITFYFPKYEIAPGLAGVIDVEVPMEKIIPYAQAPLLAVLPKDNEPVIGISTLDEPILERVDQMPEYPGGTYELTHDIAKAINYPEKAVRANKEGRVVVQFIVTRNGDVSDVKVVRSIDEDLDREAMRVVKSLPHKFTPGRKDGKPVNVWYTLPITFKLPK